MSNRITFNQMSNNVRQHIYDNYTKLDKTSQQLASGRRITRPSDDPVGVGNALEIRTNLSQLKQYDRNINDGLSYLATVDSVMQGSNNLLHSVRERALQAGNDTLNAENRRQIWEEARVTLDQMVSMANTTFKGEYVFAGTQTSSSPYEIVPGHDNINGQLTALTVGTPIQLVDLDITDAATVTGNPNARLIIPGSVSINGYTEGTDYTVDYTRGTITFAAPGATAIAEASTGGFDVNFEWVRRNEKDLDGNIYREVAENTVARLNTTASDVYGSDDQDSAWSSMITLLEGLHLDEGTTIRESIGGIDRALDRQLKAQAQNGARVNQLEATRERSENMSLSLTDLQSQIEDVDFAEAVTQMSMQQAVYDASLQVSARAIQSTLLNFL